MIDHDTTVTDSGNSDQCGATGETCYAARYECGDELYPRTIYSCSETGNSIDNGHSNPYCELSGAGSCNIYHSPPGCSQCASLSFKQSFDHPCLNCKDVFGDICLGCNDFTGCCGCQSGFGMIWDEDTNMWFCHPTPCLNPDYNCRVCNWDYGGTYCSQCNDGFTLRDANHCI